MAIKIYFFGPMDRSGRVRWLLAEMGVAYEDHRLDYQKQEHKSEEYLKINPLGAIPAIEEDGKVLTESGAICVYLADKYQDKQLAPALDSPHRGKFMQWMFMIPASIEPILNDGFKSSQLPEDERNKAFAQIVEKFNPVLDMISDHLGEQDYFIDNKFSAVDVMLASTLNWANNFKLIQDRPNVESYLARMKDREAAQKVGVFLPITPPSKDDE
ncbi:glutathione S-transferase family protein [Candidatus Uabimicrobium amorphum]|uniref:Glutathione S-transferase n=1 Tax=Uabimicrobium amorphum TaxID=2596890 RepID=A0A5S9IHU1_UABAM|nr:glutathione S-transferase family protein [Candidatus Uabimicrobium amorphum]BBM81820.1 glutathione S-transferase [Candidatus Uabimicrobium amorphum]